MVYLKNCAWRKIKFE